MLICMLKRQIHGSTRLPFPTDLWFCLASNSHIFMALPCNHSWQIYVSATIRDRFIALPCNHSWQIYGSALRPFVTDLWLCLATIRDRFMALPCNHSWQIYGSALQPFVTDLWLCLASLSDHCHSRGLNIVYLNPRTSDLLIVNSFHHGQISVPRAYSDVHTKLSDKHSWICIETIFKLQDDLAGRRERCGSPLPTSSPSPWAKVVYTWPSNRSALGFVRCQRASGTWRMMQRRTSWWIS